jgi:hypothetical protein
LPAKEWYGCVQSMRCRALAPFLLHARVVGTVPVKCLHFGRLHRTML